MSIQSYIDICKKKSEIVQQVATVSKESVIEPIDDSNIMYGMHGISLYELQKRFYHLSIPKNDEPEYDLGGDPIRYTLDENDMFDYIYSSDSDKETDDDDFDDDYWSNNRRHKNDLY